MKRDVDDLVEELNAMAKKDFRSIDVPLDNPALYSKMAAIVQLFSAASSEDAIDLRAGLAPQSKLAFLRYAWEAAEEAVSKGNSEEICSGLVALAIENGESDLRDSIVRMTLAYHSAEKLRVDPAKFFIHAARITSNAALQQELSSFAMRTPKDRDYRGFYIREHIGKGTFRYVQDPWPKPNARFTWLKELFGFI